MTPELLEALSGVVAQILAFLILLWVLKRYAWKPLIKVLDERQELIEREFHKISALEKKHQALAVEYQEKLAQVEEVAHKRYLEQVTLGKEMAQQVIDEAHKEAQDVLNKTKQHIASELASAREQLKGELSLIVVSVTEKLLKEQLDEKKHRELIQSFIAEVENRQ